MPFTHATNQATYPLKIKSFKLFQQNDINHNVIISGGSGITESKALSALLNGSSKYVIRVLSSAPFKPISMNQIIDGCGTVYLKKDYLNLEIANLLNEFPLFAHALSTCVMGQIIGREFLVEKGIQFEIHEAIDKLYAKKSVSLESVVQQLKSMPEEDRVFSKSIWERIEAFVKYNELSEQFSKAPADTLDQVFVNYAFEAIDPVIKPLAVLRYWIRALNDLTRISPSKRPVIVIEDTLLKDINFSAYFYLFGIMNQLNGSTIIVSKDNNNLDLGTYAEIHGHANTVINLNSDNSINSVFVR